MSGKKRKERISARGKSATPKSSKASHLLSIFLLTIAFLLFSIVVPLVQIKIDRFSAEQKNYQFHGLQAFLYQKWRVDQIDLNYYLNFVVEEKLVDQKTVRVIDRMKERINKRHKEHTIVALALLLFDPSEEGPDFLKSLFENCYELPCWPKSSIITNCWTLLISRAIGK